ncbi:hypothetical protein LOTGIDRAFT_232864 [Lottia gigantea]|uniref:Phospholipid scramblase n=1 Tax=Lottia gigantea TaxID=225164 RepID=V4ADE4_LOTGI|nr:hypothetical protein LOTGIDRAFT_232864 [Lottia gigantea]ESO93145.1 hypothetical protein LOTGIDRAFT_232864 [Lottia gigantea]
MAEEKQQIIETQPCKQNAEEFPNSSLNLTAHNDILVHQLLDVVEVIFAWSRISRYQILDADDNQLLYVYEVADCYGRQCFSGLREFKLKITVDDNVLYSVYRPKRCTSRCCFMCCQLQQLDILNSTGAQIASVHEKWSCLKPIFHINDKDNELLYIIEGSSCHCRLGSDIKFQVLTTSGEVISTITRIWSGCRDCIGAVDDFKINFNEGLTNEERWLILCASFLIDANYFQKHSRLCWW